MGDDRGESSVKAIIVAVIIALLVGGSAPWWWEKVFPKPQPPNDGATSTPSREPPKGIGACASGDSPSNEFHDTAAPNGSWDWNCDGNIEREYTVCENLSRKDCDPSTNQTGAKPGFCTELRAESGCAPTLGDCGKPGYVYPCFYNPADGRCHAGGYETAAVMRCK